MATVSDLVPSISFLSLIEQIAIIKRTRLSRRTQKFKPEKARTAKTKRRAKKRTMRDVVATLTKAQKAELRKQLLGV